MRRSWMPPAVGVGLFLSISLVLHFTNADAYRWLAAWAIGLSSVDYFRAVTGYPSSWRVRVMYAFIVSGGLVIGLTRMPTGIRPEWLGARMSTDPWIALRSAVAPALVAGAVTALASVLTIVELRHALDSDDDIWDHLAAKHTSNGRRWTVWSRPVIAWLGGPASIRLVRVAFEHAVLHPVKRIPGLVLTWFTMCLGVVLLGIGLLSTHLGYELGTAFPWGVAGLMAETVVVGMVVALSGDLGRVVWSGIRRWSEMLLPALALVAAVGVFRYSIGWSTEDIGGGQWLWYVLSAVRGALLSGYAALLLWVIVGTERTEDVRRSLPVGLEWIALVVPITIAVTALAYSGVSVWAHTVAITYACAGVVAVAAGLLLFAPRAHFTRQRARVVWVGAAGCALSFAYIELALLSSGGALNVARLAVLFLGVWASLGSVATFGSFLTSDEAISTRTLWKRTLPWVAVGLAVAGGSGALYALLVAQAYPDTLLVDWLRLTSLILVLSAPGMLVIGSMLIMLTGRLSKRAVEKPLA